MDNYSKVSKLKEIDNEILKLSNKKEFVGLSTEEENRLNELILIGNAVYYSLDTKYNNHHNNTHNNKIRK